MDNIDDFNNVVGVIFSILYKEFPNPKDLDYMTVLFKTWGDNTELEDKPIDEDTDFELTEATAESKEQSIKNAQLAESYSVLFRNTMYWLKSENFITYDSEDLTVFIGSVLSEKGLSALSVIPSSLTASIGDSLVQAVEDGAKGGIMRFVKLALNDFVPDVTSRVILGMLKP